MPLCLNAFEGVRKRRRQLWHVSPFLLNLLFLLLRCFPYFLESTTFFTLMRPHRLLFANAYPSGTSYHLMFRLVLSFSMSTDVFYVIFPLSKR